LSVLEDARQVDLEDTGKAQPLGKVRPSDRRIIDMCQHPESRQVFATCDSEGNIMIWNWLGTRTGEDNESAVRVTNVVNIRNALRGDILKMCFHSFCRHPDCYTLLVLSHVPNRDWLKISVFTISGFHVVSECMERLPFHNDHLTAEHARNYPCRISHFDVSSSGWALVVAGEQLLQMFSISTDEAGTWSLSSIKPERDEAKFVTLPEVLQHGGGSVSSVCTSPVSALGAWQKRGKTVGLTDFIVIGMSSGEMYGVPLNCSRGQQGDVVTIGPYAGRFPRQRHTKNVRICSIMTVAPPEDESSDRTRLVSLGSNGKQVTWVFDVDSENWAPIEELDILPEGQQGRTTKDGIVASQSSASVKTVLLAADEKEKCVLAVDRVTGHSTSCSVK